MLRERGGEGRGLFDSNVSSLCVVSPRLTFARRRVYRGKRNDRRWGCVFSPYRKSSDTALNRIMYLTLSRVKGIFLLGRSFPRFRGPDFDFSSLREREGRGNLVQCEEGGEYK